MIINKNKSSPIWTHFKCNDTIISDENEITEIFFVNVGTTLAAVIAPSNKNPLEHMKNNTNMIFQSSPVTEKEVENILLHLKDTSSGWDELYECYENY